MATLVHAMDFDVLKQRLTPLCDDPTIRLVVLFGSSVKGGQHRRSDVDLAVLGSTPLDLIGLTNRVTTLLHSNRVDVVDLQRASPLLMMEVVRSGRLLYEQRAGQYVSFCSLAHRRYVDTAKLRKAQQQAIETFLRARGEA